MTDDSPPISDKIRYIFYGNRLRQRNLLPLSPEIQTRPSNRVRLMMMMIILLVVLVLLLLLLLNSFLFYSSILFYLSFNLQSKLSYQQVFVVFLCFFCVFCNSDVRAISLASESTRQKSTSRRHSPYVFAVFLSLEHQIEAYLSLISRVVMPLIGIMCLIERSAMLERNL